MCEGVGILSEMVRPAVIGAILCLALGALQGAAAQQGKSAVADTDTSDRVVIVDLGLSLGIPTLLLPRALDEKSAFVLPPFGTRRMESLGQPLPFVVQPLRHDIDMLAPLHLQWEREKELQPLYMVLGAVELGGVAYIAYRHVKKYGLLK
jgi:hypothetical protein